MIGRATEAALIDTLRAAAPVGVPPCLRLTAADDTAKRTGPKDPVAIAGRVAEAMLTDTIAWLLPQADCVGEEAVSDDLARAKRLSEPG